MPTVVMSGRTEPWVNLSQNGAGFYALAPSRLKPVIGGYEESVIIMCGGIQDVEDAVNAQGVLDAYETYADLVRGYGADKIIATTITKSVNFDAGEEAIRVAANELLLGSDAFDDVVDIAALDPERDVDGVHWSPAGVATVATPVEASLEVQLAAL